MSAPQLPIRTQRLLLRTHQPEDKDWLQAVYSRPDVARFLLEEPWDDEVAARQIEQRVQRTGLESEVAGLALVVEADGVPIGDVALWLTDKERGVAEIGWVLDPEHGGNGYAREAVTAMLALAFEHYGLHRVAAQMDARNEASARLASAVGMQREAHLRQDWWCKGEWTDTLVFGMLASDRA